MRERGREGGREGGVGGERERESEREMNGWRRMLTHITTHDCASLHMRKYLRVYTVAVRVQSTPHSYMYLHICTHSYIYLHICTYMYIHICIYPIHIYTYIYLYNQFMYILTLCIQTHTHTHTHTSEVRLAPNSYQIDALAHRQPNTSHARVTKGFRV